MKRTMICILAALLSATMLSGCGKQGTSSTEETPAAPQQTETTAASDSSADSAAAADDSSEDDADDAKSGELPDNFIGKLQIDDVGVSLDFPYASQNGLFSFSGYSFTDDEKNVKIGNATLYFDALETKELYEAMIKYQDEAQEAELLDKEMPQAADERFLNAADLTALLFNVVSLTGDYGDSATDYLKGLLQPEYVDRVTTKKIDTKGDTDFFLIQYEMTDQEKEKYKSAMGDYYDEFIKISEDEETFLSALTLFEPVFPEEEEEEKIDNPEGKASFETMDLDGNPVKSEDIFKGHKVIMINLWATWCTPCKVELEELGRFAKQLEEKDCLLIGLCQDAGESEEKCAIAKKILEKNGCEYMNLIVDSDMLETFNTGHFPSTFFVDSEGNFIGSPVIGARVDKYPLMIDACLAEME